MEGGETGLDDESAPVRNIRDPRQGHTTESDLREHVNTHRPCRSWYKFCVMGRGVNSPDRRSHAQDDLEAVPHVSMDCAFFGGLFCWSTVKEETD